jgi:hypothetical protein
MTPTRATILAALVAGLGLAALSPAFAAGGPQHQRHAQDHRPDQRPDHRQSPDQRQGRMLDFQRSGGGAFRLAEVTCSPRAAERLEIRLDRMSARLALTDEQEPLFQDFRTAALTAQTSFADECATLRPSRGATTDLVERLEQRLKFDEARLAASSELIPQFATFYESLTEAQKADLMPTRQHQGMNRPGQHGKQHRSGVEAPMPE